jgi:hypothetical protein
MSRIVLETALIVVVALNVLLSCWQCWRIRTWGRVNRAMNASLWIALRTGSPLTQIELARFMIHQRQLSPITFVRVVEEE